MRFYNDDIMLEDDMDDGRASTVINLEQSIAFSVSANWTGDVTGSLALEASNDQVRWSRIPSSVVALTSGLAPGGYTNWTWNHSAPAFRFARLTVSAVSGGGQISARVNSKGF